jgi:hypothetical protein
MKFAALLLTAAVCAAQTESPGSISGVVRDAASGAPVSNCKLKVETADHHTLQVPVDALGQYTLAGLAAGNFTISAASPVPGQSHASETSRKVKLETGQQLRSIDLRLPSTGAITGRVLDENDQPISGAQVFRVDEQYYHGALRRWLGNGGVTNDRGEYSLTGIPAATAFLVETRNRSILVKGEGDTPANTFYPSASSVESAAEIILNPGETRAGVDIHRLKLPSYCISGLVEGAGADAVKLSVRDLAATDTSSASGDIAEVEMDGTFRVCGLHPGRYRLTSTKASPGNSQQHYSAAAQVTLVDRDAPDVTLLQNLPSPLTANYVWDGDPSDHLPKVSGTLSMESPSGGIKMIFKVPGNFSASFPLAPDNYAIDVSDIREPGVYVKEMSCGGRDILHGLAPLGGSLSCGSLRLVLARDGGPLTARVVDDLGNAVSDAYVAIVPQSAATAAGMSEVMTSGQTDINGAFSAGRLAPGKYRAFATYERLDLSANRIAWLWAAQSRAQEVEIAPNGSAQITVRLQPLH